MISKLILRRIQKHPYRVLFSVLAISSVISLVMVLEGFREGIFQQIRHMVLSRGADVIVSQAGVSNMIASRSLLPQLSRIEIEKIEGVLQAHPLTTLPVIYHQGNRSTPVFVIVYDTYGGPTEIEQGSSIEKGRDIVIDKSLSAIYGLQLGDDFIISDFKFKVAGISKNTAAFFAPFAFIKYDDLIDLYFDSDIVGDLSTLPLLSFLMVEVSQNHSANKVISEIEKLIPRADAFLPEQIAENDVAMSRSMLGVVFQLMIFISYVICVLVISLIMFSTIQERKSELAVFKAIGFSQFKLSKLVFMETVVLTVLAIPIANIFAYLLAQLIQEIAPVYLILSNESGVLVRTFVASIFFALLGALLSLRTVVKLDPALAFRY